MDDFELLQAYAKGRAEDAFSTLTARYINLVYSAAARQTGNPHAAEDVTQAVFLTLARKAGAISHNTILSGWLLRTTRFAAANARRLEQRRQHYEQQAMHSYVCPTESEAAWQRIAPVLDDALDRLGEKDRAAIVLRFFEQQSLKNVAAKLGVSEDGAQKRVSRALEKLRQIFVRNGKGVSALILAGTLAANSVQAAPPILATSICAAVGSQSAVAGSVVATIANATVATLARIRLQSLAVRVGSVAILLSLVVTTFLRSNRTEISRNESTPVPSRGAAPTAAKLNVLPATALAAVPSEPEGKKLLLHVVDSQSGAPVTNAQLILMSIAEFPRRSTNIFVTDMQGAGRVSYSPIPVKAWSHRIEIFRDGYVPKYLSWSESQQDTIEEIPAEYSIKVERAITIGGIVVDERNAPVAGVRVVFSVTGPIDSRSRERSTMMGNYHTKVTDAAGQWSCNHVPDRFGMITYRLIHPQFQEMTYASDSPDTPNYTNIERLSETGLRAGRAVMRLKPGLIIAGIVTDENGSPVVGAKVTQGYNFRVSERNMITTADGSFRFGNGRAQELALTVQAAGFAPVITSFVMNASIENLRISLPVGRILRGRVVDETGEPIATAAIEAASPTADSRTLFEWRTKTDSQGSFSWNDAPASQDYAIYASGYETRSRMTLVADGTEQLIQLNKKTNAISIRILGQIVDAETKLAPTGASVQIWETRNESGGIRSFTTQPSSAAPDGSFRLKTSSGTSSYVLEAQADGYYPERLTNQVTGTANVPIKIELKKAPLHAGVVLTPTGDPATGATLALCGAHEWAQMSQPGKLQVGRSAGLVGTVAGAEGRFQLPAKHAPEVVVVAHRDGFAEMPISEVTSNTTIALQPWGRVEGTARARNKPLVGETIRLGAITSRSSQSPRVSLLLKTITDSEGGFVFESVPPAEWKVAREINVRAEGKYGLHIPLYSHVMPATVEPGRTSRVALGGSGRTVIGKAVLPNATGSVPWTDNAVALALKVASTVAPVRPARESFESAQAFGAAMKAFYEQTQKHRASEEGKAFERLQREYRAMFASDGSFRIEDVPPGDYTVTITLAEPAMTPRETFTDQNVIGALVTNIAIPENGIEPFDLGVLELKRGAAHQASR